MSISIQWEPEGLFITAHSEFDFKRTDNQLAPVFSDPRYKNCQYTLIDVADVKFVSIDQTWLTDFATAFLVGEQRTAEFKLAIVSKKNTLETEIEEYLSQTKSSARQTQVFHSIDEARHWLNA